MKSPSERKRSLWVGKVKTVSTFPPEGIFTKDAATIARVMASSEVSPKGIGSAIRMIQYFINRAGKNLSASRRKVLEQAKHILQKERAAESGTKLRTQTSRIRRKRAGRTCTVRKRRD